MAPGRFLSAVTACLIFTALVGADTNVVVPADGKTLPVASVADPQTGPTTRSGDPAVSEPDQTFSADHAGVDATVGANNGVPEDSATLDPNGLQQAEAETTHDPVGDVNARVNRIDGRRLLGGRKMLGDLDLSGDGVSAGNDEAGVTARGYGHGVASDDALNTNAVHIEPHGVEATATADGTDTTVGGNANPDCLGNEGSCVGVEGK